MNRLDWHVAAKLAPPLKAAERLVAQGGGANALQLTRNEWTANAHRLLHVP